MYLTTRSRFLLLLLLSCFVGWLTISWGLIACESLVKYYVRGHRECTRTWRDFGNGGCGLGSAYNVYVGWIEVLGCIAVLLALGWLLTRWVLAPIRSMIDTIGRLGPTSLGLRLNATGPHDETRRLSDALDGMLDRVAEGYESQRRFAANASHELRTPLATQRALIEVSLTDALTPDQIQLLSRQLLATNERNENLIEGLLALAETERGLMTHVPLRLDVIADEVVDRYRPLAEKAGIAIEIAADEVTVIGEEPLLDRLISNLVHNAIKYNDRGGATRVHVEAPATLVVSNTGPHVPEEAVPGLFEPFRRLSGERLDHGGGAGLGLTIVRSIVSAHAGSLDARSNADGGLTVTVRFAAVAGS
jgi:signal transduction histidine kinase